MLGLDVFEHRDAELALHPTFKRAPMLRDRPQDAIADQILERKWARRRCARSGGRECGRVGVKRLCGIGKAPLDKVMFPILCVRRSAVVEMHLKRREELLTERKPSSEERGQNLLDSAGEEMQLKQKLGAHSVLTVLQCAIED